MMSKSKIEVKFVEIDGVNVKLDVMSLKRKQYNELMDKYNKDPFNGVFEVLKYAFKEDGSRFYSDDDLDDMTFYEAMEVHEKLEANMTEAVEDSKKN